MTPIDYTLPLDQLPDPLPIEPLTRPFDVTITPPGSKSITCRAYVLAALAGGGGESKIIRPLRADDTDRLLEALCTLGTEARWEGEDVFIKGVSGRFPRGGNLYMGDGGTPTRFMIACACLAAEPVVIDASPRMRERPIAEGVEMLRQLGAKIEFVEEKGRLPVRVTPSAEFVGGRLSLRMTESSQFVSAILLIAPFTEKGISIGYKDRVSSPSYVQLTRDVLRRYGLRAGSFVFADGAAKEDRIAPQRIRSGEMVVPPDASSSAYWFVSAALNALSRIRIPDLGWWKGDGRIMNLDQPDLGVITALAVDDFILQEHWVGIVSGDAVPAIDFDAESMPDGAVVLAAYSAQGNGKSRIRGLRTLRVKETDRIAALANELRKVGCTVETGEDWIEITPPHAGSDERNEEDPAWVRRDSAPVIIETYNDHRMAMAFAVLGLVAPNGHRLAIRNPKCVAKSYPTFWKDFAKLYQ